MTTFKKTFFLVRSPILSETVRKDLRFTPEQDEALTQACEMLLAQNRDHFARALTAPSNRAARAMEVTVKVEDDLRVSLDSILTPEQLKRYTIHEIKKSGRFRIYTEEF